MNFLSRTAGRWKLSVALRRVAAGLDSAELGMPDLPNRDLEETTMAGLLNKIKSFMRSPKGQQMTNKARQMAQDPRNRERARQAAQKLRRKR